MSFPAPDFASIPRKALPSLLPLICFDFSVDPSLPLRVGTPLLPLRPSSYTAPLAPSSNPLLAKADEDALDLESLPSLKHSAASQLTRPAFSHRSSSSVSSVSTTSSSSTTSSTSSGMTSSGMSDSSAQSARSNWPQELNVGTVDPPRVERRIGSISEEGTDELVVETTPQQYVLSCSLHGFTLTDITLAVKKHRKLHLVADRWEWDDQTLHPSSSFQRTIHFGKDTDLVGIRAQFDGSILKIIVPRNPPITFRRPESSPYPPLTSMQASRPASSSFLRSASFCPSPPILQPILPLDTIALSKTKRQDGRLGGADAMSWPRRRSETDDDGLQARAGRSGVGAY